MIAELEDCYVLVVDDNEDTRDLLITALEIEGAIVVAVDSAIAALKLLERCCPDIILCDLAMPEMDGFTLMKQLRSCLYPQWNQLPAIAMTAMYGECYQTQAIEVGFQMCFYKPVDLEQLLQAMRSLLRAKKSDRVRDSRYERSHSTAFVQLSTLDRINSSGFGSLLLCTHPSIDQSLPKFFAP
ncbi:response regulator [Leptolyngbya sp. NIES-2104]|uniref:response regulator n=1 Tax=Leptolyngbya sp. NIES-2104 TaxID=1552121 RepID=UPI0006EC4364|nr:response regulator [Leptolyngbya sp. NIES-2104]GAP99404.1 two-component hybrid sensor and regulator [Leptolyngbya sp. NIES-2104]